LGALGTIADQHELLAAIEARMTVAADPQLHADERVRLIGGLVNLLPKLPESQALPLLQRFLILVEGVTPSLRALVLEDALKVAGHFGRTPLVKHLVMSLGNLINELGPEGAPAVGAMLVSGLRSLRRVGLREEVSELLLRASTVLKGDDLKTLVARVALAGGFYVLEASASAEPIIEEALRRLNRESGLGIHQRCTLTRAVALALSHAAQDVALPGLVRLTHQLPWITDSYPSNEYVCASMVDVADSLVLGHVGDDLTLNETARHILDENELLVRRRIHRDIGGF